MTPTKTPTRRGAKRGPSTGKRHPQRDRLETYRSRRDFRRSPEPSGRGSRRWKKARNPIFVIQEHDARSHHFDLRIEIDGALASWAVPKGPSTNPRTKRLAQATEDHPLDYADFEGVIPADAYGAGAVIVWDAGPYRNLRTDGDGGAEVPMSQCRDEGRIEVWLAGKKLRGGFTLVNAKLRGDPDAWLLIKKRDEGADARRNPVNTERRSVLTGRTIREVARDEGDAEERA